MIHKQGTSPCRDIVTLKLKAKAPRQRVFSVLGALHANSVEIPLDGGGSCRLRLASARLRLDAEACTFIAQSIAYARSFPTNRTLAVEVNFKGEENGGSQSSLQAEGGLDASATDFKARAGMRGSRSKEQKKSRGRAVTQHLAAELTCHRVAADVITDSCIEWIFRPDIVQPAAVDADDVGTSGVLEGWLIGEPDPVPLAQVQRPTGRHDWKVHAELQLSESDYFVEVISAPNRATNFVERLLLRALAPKHRAIAKVLALQGLPKVISLGHLAAEGFEPCPR